MQHTLAFPVSMFPATTAVTELSVWVTPWATTPLSAQKAATAFFRFRPRGATPAIPDDHVLQQPQAVERLGHRVPVPPGLGHPLLVRRPDLLQGPGQVPFQYRCLTHDIDASA